MFKVLICTDDSYASEPTSWIQKLERLCSRPWNQKVGLWLRERALSAEAYEDLASAVLSKTRAAQIPLLLRGHVDLAKKLTVGTHLPSTGILPEQARAVLGEDALIGRSCHSFDEYMDHDPCDYITISPLWPTPSKPGHPGIVNQIQAVPKNGPAIFALGGLRLDNIHEAIGKGFHGIAAQSLIWGAKHPEKVAAEILAQISHSTSHTAP